MEDFKDKVYQLLQQGKYNDAIDLCDKEILINPNDLNLYYLKATAHFMQKQYPRLL